MHYLVVRVVKTEGVGTMDPSLIGFSLSLSDAPKFSVKLPRTSMWGGGGTHTHTHTHT